MDKLPIFTILALAGCKDDSTAGAPCDEADDCFHDFSDEELGGDRMCFTDIPGGYCTQTCTTDASCCEAGQCDEGLAYFCEQLESNDETTCFVSCEDADGGEAVCDDLGGPWVCRNTGGGDGRKFCSPQE
jgi:hypothetical protein